MLRPVLRPRCDTPGARGRNDVPILIGLCLEDSNSGQLFSTLAFFAFWISIVATQFKNSIVEYQ